MSIYDYPILQPMVGIYNYYIENIIENQIRKALKVELYQVSNISNERDDYHIVYYIDVMYDGGFFKQLNLKIPLMAGSEFDTGDNIDKFDPHFIGGYFRKKSDGLRYMATACKNYKCYNRFNFYTSKVDKTKIVKVNIVRTQRWLMSPVEYRTIKVMLTKSNELYILRSYTEDSKKTTWFNLVDHTFAYDMKREYNSDTVDNFANDLKVHRQRILDVIRIMMKILDVGKDNDLQDSLFMYNVMNPTTYLEAAVTIWLLEQRKQLCGINNRPHGPDNIFYNRNTSETKTFKQHVGDSGIVISNHLENLKNLLEIASYAGKRSKYSSTVQKRAFSAYEHGYICYLQTPANQSVGIRGQLAIGTLISYPKLHMSFINKLKHLNFKKRGRFEIVINAIDIRTIEDDPYEVMDMLISDNFDEAYCYFYVPLLNMMFVDTSGCKLVKRFYDQKQNREVYLDIATFNSIPNNKERFIFNDKRKYFSIFGNQIVKPLNNHPSRCILATSMIQKCSASYSLNEHYDYKSILLINREVPIISSKLLNGYPFGTNLIVFYDCTADNMEDSITVNKETVNNGKLDISIVTNQYKCTSKSSRIKDYVMVRKGDMVFNKTLLYKEKEKEMKYKAVLGRVISVDVKETTIDKETQHVIIITIQSFFRWSGGDKMASICGQKMVSAELAEQDSLSYVYYEGMKIYPDIVVNSISIYKRLTLAMIYETIVSLCKVIDCNDCKCHDFDPSIMGNSNLLEELSNCRVIKEGISPCDSYINIKGKSIKRRNKMLWGIVYMMSLDRISELIYKDRSGSSVTKFHRQPSDGLKLGLMEFAGMISNGLSKAIVEKGSYHSDRAVVTVCSQCGFITNIRGLCHCGNKEAELINVVMNYSVKQTIQTFNTLGIHIGVLSKNRVRV